MTRYYDSLALQSRVAKLPTFRAETYLGLHADLQDLPVSDGVAHFVAFGIGENRAFATPAGIVAGLDRLGPGDPIPDPGTDTADLLTRFVGEDVGLYLSAQCDRKVRLAAEMMAGALMAFGITVRLRDETADPLARAVHSLVFDPQDFFLRPGAARWLRQDVLADLVLCPMEPFHKRIETLPLLLGCRALIDANTQNGLLYRACGLPHAEFIGQPRTAGALLDADLTLDPLARSLPPEVATAGPGPVDWHERSIDLCHFGERHLIRDEVFIHGAPILAELDCFTPYPTHEPATGSGHGPARARIALEQRVARHAKIILSIDPEEIGSVSPYDMALLGFGNGALVLSRPLHPHPVFEPGEHFLEASSRDLAGLAEWILSTREGSDLGAAIAGRAQAAFAGARYRYHAVYNVLRLLDETRSRVASAPLG